jgi:hypothetical protein
VYERHLRPSRKDGASDREIHLILADGQTVTIYCLEGGPRRVLLGIKAPETVQIRAGALDLTS